MKNAICSWLLLVACAAFAAEDYPAKPIQMIVPSALPGAGVLSSVEANSAPA